MMKTYQIGDSESHPVKQQIRAVEDAFAEVGHTVDLMDMVKPKPGTTLFNDGYLITPDFSEALENVLDNVDWLSVNADITGHFGDPTGSTEVTAVVVENGLSVGEVVDLLDRAEYSTTDDTDMITKMIYTVDMVSRPSDPDAVEVVAYDLLRKSLGWLAEKTLAATDDFKKAAASHDSWGIDLMATSDTWSDYDFAPEAAGVRGFQLKTMQRVTSQSLHNKDHKHPHLSYAWVKGGIVVADMAERSGSDKQAKEVAADANSTMTVVKKSLKSGTTGDYHRPARLIAWE